ncbi:MAG: hypothetical protein ACHQJD_00400 [Thermoanaerobaculia bacterium]
MKRPRAAIRRRRVPLETSTQATCAAIRASRTRTIATGTTADVLRAALFEPRPAVQLGAAGIREEHMPGKRKPQERHAAATALGAAGAGAAGALTGGSMAGPAGAVLGGIAGAAAGALAGNAFAAEFDATEEAKYWRENFGSRPYRRPDRDFSYYEPAYRYGWESARRYADDVRSFEETESELAEGWLSWMVGDSSPGHEWSELRGAVRDAWRRVRGD